MNIFLPLVLLTLGLDAAAADYAGKPDCRILDFKLGSGDTVSWSGACVDGYAHGKGILQLFHSSEPVGGYDGVIERGLLQGEGEQFFADGDSYKGSFRDGRPNGKGIFRYAKGGSIRGEFHNGGLVAGSQVERLYAEGDRYTGGWRKGKPNGQGERIYALGGSYQGGWENGEFSGEGTIRYPNGKVLSTTFKAEPASEAAERDQYYYRAPGAQNQSILSRNSSRAISDLPVNPGYADLTPAQQALLKKSYPILQAQDEPPYPLHGMTALVQLAQSAQKGIPVEGVLRLDVMVDAEGHATAVKILQSPSANPDYGRMFAAAAMRQAYKPAICAGAPCAMAYPIKLKMALD
jgi:hypothetical protein